MWFLRSRSSRFTIRTSDVLISGIWAELWRAERKWEKKSCSKQGTQLEQRHIEGTHVERGAWRSLLLLYQLTPWYSPLSIQCLDPHPCPLQESSTCGWQMGGGSQSSGGGDSKLMVTVNKSSSQRCRRVLVSNCYKHWVSQAVRNASEHSERLLYVQLKQ